MDIQKHYIDVNGNHFVAVFNTQRHADSYKQPTGAIEVEPRPTSKHQWVNGQWAAPESEK